MVCARVEADTAEMPSRSPRILIAVDTGGTFTDLVLSDGSGTLWSHKRPSTPDDPGRAVVEGIEALLGKYTRSADGDGASEAGGAAGIDDVHRIVHGSTVATNALLEGKGARAAFVTTAGFEDTLHIARQDRPRLYDLQPHRPDSPIPRDRCLGIAERMAYDGEVVRALDGEAIERTVERLASLDVESVAISLLHSYANDEHERRLAGRVRERLPALHVTVSSELLPEFREYERAATCVVNAVVAPPMSRYIGRLAERLGEDRLRVMASAGGTLPVDVVGRHAAHTILSGPAGGVLGAWKVGQAAGFERVIGFDMGGTSTDVCLCDGGPARTTKSEIGDLPVRMPMIDIHTVGAGGGSIARVDAGGALRVGPESTGADPGPASYGRQAGDPIAAVTDAHVVLGHLSPDEPLGGELALDADRARTAVRRVADDAGLSLEAAAEGVLRVAEVTMARAIGRISVQRGHDPRRFVLVAFGGAGALHAARLAERIGMTRVLVPRRAGLLSAVGMLDAGPRYTFSQAVMGRIKPSQREQTPLGQLDAVRRAKRTLGEEGEAALVSERIAAEDRRFDYAVDLRYAEQSYEITVGLDEPDPIASFEAWHEQLYGYRDASKPIEIVALRLDASGAVNPVPLERIGPRDGRPPENLGTARRVWEDDRWRDWRAIDREALQAGDELAGPLLINEYSATTVVPRSWRLAVDPHGQLLLNRQG